MGCIAEGKRSASDHTTEHSSNLPHSPHCSAKGQTPRVAAWEKETRRAQDKMAHRILWPPPCFSHPHSCCTQGGDYMKQEMMNMLLSAGPNLKLQSQTNSRQHSLSEKLLSSLLFVVSAENPPVIQSTNIYISKK